LGAFVVFAALGSFKPSEAGASLMFVVIAAAILGVGILWLRSLKPTFHVILASAAAERQGLSSKDGTLINRVTVAINDAITHRG
jgi:hypothetical protein